MVGPRADALTVLYVSETYTPHDRRFLAALADRVASVAWLSLRPRAAGGEARPPPDGVAVLPEVAGTDGPDRAAAAIAGAARGTRAHVVHAGPVPSVGLAAVRAAAAPVVVVAWGSDVLLATERGDAPLVREALSRAAGFVADARCVERAAERLGLPATTPRAVFPWGVEADRLEPPRVPSPLRRRLGWDENGVVVATRAWTAAYRTDVLVHAVAAAVTVSPRLRVALLGDGPEAPLVRDRLRAWVDRGAVVCPGRVPEPEVRSWLEAADVYVSAVPSDGSSVSLLEAMAAARPPVVVDAQGNREWVEPGRSGWLVPAGDAGATASALLEATGDLDEARRRGARARETVLTRARWDDNVGALVDLYRRVLA